MKTREDVGAENATSEEYVDGRSAQLGLATNVYASPILIFHRLIGRRTRQRRTSCRRSSRSPKPVIGVYRAKNCCASKRAGVRDDLAQRALKVVVRRANGEPNIARRLRCSFQWSGRLSAQGRGTPCATASCQDCVLGRSPGAGPGIPRGRAACLGLCRGCRVHARQRHRAQTNAECDGGCSRWGGPRDRRGPRVPRRRAAASSTDGQSSGVTGRRRLIQSPSWRPVAPISDQLPLGG